MAMMRLRQEIREISPTVLGRAMIYGTSIPLAVAIAIMCILAGFLSIAYNTNLTGILLTSVSDFIRALTSLIAVLTGIWFLYSYIYLLLISMLTVTTGDIPICSQQIGKTVLKAKIAILSAWHLMVAKIHILITPPRTCPASYPQTAAPSHLSSGWQASTHPQLA